MSSLLYILIYLFKFTLFKQSLTKFLKSSLRFELISGTGEFTILYITLIGCKLWNGVYPSDNSYAIIPKLQISDFSSIVYDLIVSGAIQCGYLFFAF